jgi:hypothetical protein
MEFSAIHGEFSKFSAAVGQDAGRVQKVVDDDRSHGVEFKIALTPGEGDGGVITHDLNGDHDHCFALRGMDLAGHDRRTWLVARQLQLCQPATRARSEPAHVVGDLDQRHRQPAHRGVATNNGVKSPAP